MNEHNDILKALRQQLKEHHESQGYPLQVPEDYFPGLENSILSKVLDEEDAGLISLDDKGKKQTFTVPDGYFHNLEKDILKKTMAPAPGRLFSLKWRPAAAAAASIIGLVILGSIYYRETSHSEQTNAQNNAVSTSVIQNVSIGELADFVEEGSTGNSTGNDKKKSVDINQLFQQVSNQDLESFLNETAVNNTELF